MPLPGTPLFTSRLRLRPYEPADAPAFFALLQQNRARLQASFAERLTASPTLEAATATLAGFANDWQTGRFYVFGIWHLSTDVYLGDICLMPQRDEQAEIGYYLAQEAEGHGYAREALEATCRFGFEEVRSGLLLIRCFANNARAQAVALAAGFRLEKQPTRLDKLWEVVAATSIRRFVRSNSSFQLENR